MSLSGWRAPQKYLDRFPRQPSMAAVATRMLGPRQTGALPYVNMNDGGFGFHGGAWLGVAQNPFQTGDYSYGNEAGRLPAGNTESLKLVDGLTRDRLADRKQPLSGFDRILRMADRNGVFESLDRIIYRALGLKPVDVIMDRANRPVHLLPGGEVPRELLG